MDHFGGYLATLMFLIFHTINFLMSVFLFGKIVESFFLPAVSRTENEV